MAHRDYNMFCNCTENADGSWAIFRMEDDVTFETVGTKAWAVERVRCINVRARLGYLPPMSGDEIFAGEQYAERALAADYAT